MSRKSLLSLLLSLLAAIGLYGGSNQNTPEQTFWIWFQNNQNALFDFEKNQEQTFGMLSAQLHKINPTLTFEFGPIEQGRREFTISADGIKDAFPAVEALYAAAPQLPRWKILKFRHRRVPSDISYGSVFVKATTITVEIKPAGHKADLVLFIPGYTESSRDAYLSIAFLMLDQSLGEYDVETRVGNIQVKPKSPPSGPTHTLQDLPRVIDAMFGH
jgi:hypothetical protein